MNWQRLFIAESSNDNLALVRSLIIIVIYSMLNELEYLMRRKLNITNNFNIQYKLGCVS